MTYQVEISAIKLERADGTRVSVMATSQMVDFVDYTELNELASASTVLAGMFWTLPPRLRLGEKAKEKYADIGESDRMIAKVC